MPRQVTITLPRAKTKTVGRQQSLDLISASRYTILLVLSQASFELKTTLNAVAMYLGWKQQSNQARGCITSLPVLSLGAPPSFSSSNLLPLHQWSPITKERWQQSVRVTKAYQLTWAADLKDETTWSVYETLQDFRSDERLQNAGV